MNIFSFPHLDDIVDARKALGDKVVSLEMFRPGVLTYGTPQKGMNGSEKCIARYGSIRLNAVGGEDLSGTREQIWKLLRQP